MRHNPLAIIVVVVLHHVLGFLWYGPLFMKAWAAGHKLDAAAMQPSAGPFIVTLICSILAAVAMSWLIQRLGVKDGMGGVRLAVIAAWQTK
jgi:hypothetical protein